NGDRSFLTIFDGDYYRGWARRTTEFAGPWHRHCPWLQKLCARFDEVIDGLLAAPATVVHPEFFPHNILIHEGRAYPSAWESAALAAGEIDLATLTDGWHPATVQSCEDAYRQARWPDGAPDRFAFLLASARLYLQFRGLGSHPSWAAAGDAR